MLLQFSVENYLSFKERAIMNLVPSKDTEHPENIVVNNNFKAVNTIATYGANASGKTSFFKAITISILMIRGSNNRQINEKLPVVPFKFDENTIGKPSKFEFQFVAKDNCKYIYGFSATSNYIEEEYLYKYASRRPAKIFERNMDKYEFTAREEGTLRPLVERNTSNKLFLATATMWNAQSTKAAFEWFAESIDTFTDLSQLSNPAINAYQGNQSNEYVRFTERLLQNSDINISNLSVKIKNVPIDPAEKSLIPGIVINGQLIQPQEKKEIEVLATHKIKNKKDVVNEYKLALDEESQGTKILFSIGPLLKDAFDKGRILIIDEIDKCLHTLLVKELINMFRNPIINKNGAQLIVTTHDTTLLSLDTFRRDQVYFVKKDNQTAESCMYSLNEYSVRKSENIEKGYLIGRYDAIPRLEMGDIL